MTSGQQGVVLVTIWILGFMFNIMVRIDGSEDDTPLALGKSILWPLFTLRYLIVALVRAGKALFQ